MTKNDRNQNAGKILTQYHKTKSCSCAYNAERQASANKQVTVKIAYIICTQHAHYYYLSHIATVHASCRHQWKSLFEQVNRQTASQWTLENWCNVPSGHHHIYKLCLQTEMCKINSASQIQFCRQWEYCAKIVCRQFFGDANIAKSWQEHNLTTIYIYTKCTP